MMDMHARTAALTIALLTVAGGCESSEDPADGSCQALAEEVQDVEDCWITLGITNGTADTPLNAARCTATALGLESPPADEVSGLAYQVAYQALCDIHGDEMPQYCEVSETLGCEG